ncbi:hypothetical protein ARD30_11250 [Bosea thiooxidans]|uniref:Uncharacterized protein n=1 Tax=Bosea thiooxidans TaxID=53254 RepID=A0A0Q3I7K7_9HYPH|nr:hypothetical protein ARD30_11250 [Bosea thiooxidans]
MEATWTPGSRARIISETKRLIQLRADNMFRQRGLRMGKDASDKQAALAAQVSMRGRQEAVSSSNGLFLPFTTEREV